jgi:hypothetical protein
MTRDPTAPLTQSKADDRQTDEQRRLLRHLKKALQDKGISLRRASKSLNCDPSTLQRLLSGSIGLSGRRDTAVRRYLSELRTPDDLQAAALELMKGFETAQMEVLLHFMQYILNASGENKEIHARPN